MVLSERKEKHLKKSGLPAEVNYFGYVLRTTTCLINVIHHRFCGKTLIGSENTGTKFCFIILGCALRK